MYYSKLFLHAVKERLIRWKELGVGCTTRFDFWSFYLFMLLIYCCCVVIYQNLAKSWAVIMLLPNLTIVIRRFHDSDHSGWNILWILVPIVGEVRILYSCGLQSKRDFGNKYWREMNSYF